MAEFSPGLGRIFICYRREETAYPAGWLFDRLAEHFGRDQIFKDVDNIELGDDFVDVISAAVGSCDVLLALIGHQWLTITDEDGRRRLDKPDDFVRLEIEAALTRAVRIIPILVEGARMPSADELPPSLAKLVRRQALELSPSRFDFDTNRLVNRLDETLAEVRTAQGDAASTSAPLKPTAPRMTEVQKAAERLGHARRSPGPSIPPVVAAAPGGPRPPSVSSKPLSKLRSRLSRRGRVLAGVGVGVVIISLLMVAIVSNMSSGPERPSAPSVQTDSGGALLLASFETGTEGWAAEPEQVDNGPTSQASDFATEGSFSLRVDSAGLLERGWYGRSFDPPIDISGKSAVSLDIRTNGVGTQEAIAVQFAPPDFSWCQSPVWGRAEPGTDATVTLDFDNIDCGDGPPPSASDRAKLTAVWVWFDGKGSFRVDNVRAE